MRVEQLVGEDIDTRACVLSFSPEELETVIKKYFGKLLDPKDIKGASREATPNEIERYEHDPDRV